MLNLFWQRVSFFVISKAVIILFALIVNFIIMSLSSSISISEAVNHLKEKLIQKNQVENISPHFKAKTSPALSALAYLLTKHGDTLLEDDLIGFDKNPSQKSDKIITVASLLGHNLKRKKIELQMLPSWGEKPVIAEMTEGRFLVVHSADKKNVIVFDPKDGTVINLPVLIFIGNWTSYVYMLNWEDVQKSVSI